MLSSSPLSHCPWHHSGTGHARKLHYIICRHITHWPEAWGQSTRFSKDTSPMDSEDTHRPHGPPSGKTSQTSDLPGTTERRCLSFPHDTPAGESWDRGLELFKCIFLSWSCWITQDSGTAHQPGVDLVKFLLLLLGHFWTQRQHPPYQRSLM